MEAPSALIYDPETDPPSEDFSNEFVPYDAPPGILMSGAQEAAPLPQQPDPQKGGQPTQPKAGK